MPVYEFECETCGRRFSEFFRRMYSAEETPHPPCPSCQSRHTLRVISSFAVRASSSRDAGRSAAQETAEPRPASFTPKEQIDSWRKKA